MVDKPDPVAIEPSLADVRADLEQLRADFAKLVDTLGAAAKHTVQGAANDAEVAAAEATDWAEEQADSLRLTIQAQPITSIAIAAGVGALLGHLLLRR
ncbi:glycine zipper domain-containing protein [Xanthobacteraceae bacterium A53D]